METPDRNTFYPVSIMYNNDAAILDFLADLTDREPIKGMDRFLKWSNGKPIALYHDCPLDDMVIILLYKSPFDKKKSEHKWMLYYTKDIRSLYNYFKMWLNVNIGYQDDLTAALTEITQLLIEVWADLPQDDKTPRLTIG